jgi:hypothetical protein
MQMRGLWIATVALALLGGVIWWNQREKSPAEQAKEMSTKTTKLMSLLEADLVEVRIEPRGEEARVLRKDSATGRWVLASQVEKEPGFRTDYDAGTTTVNNSSVFPTDKLVDEAATDLIQYGLDPPQIVVTVKDKNGKTDTVHLGDFTPVGSMLYAAKPGEKKVYTVARYLHQYITRSVEEYRDKRLLPVDEAKLSRVVVQRGGASIEFGKDGSGDWTVVQPEPMRADQLAVTELLRRAMDAKYQTRLIGPDVKKSLGIFASAKPVGALQMTVGDAVMKLEVRKTSGGEYYAKSSEHEAAYELEGDLGSTLEKELEEYRNKKLFGFGFAAVEKVALNKGGKTEVLEKKDKDWLLGGKKADAERVEELISDLRGMAALKIVKQPLGETYLEITVHTDDLKKPDTVRIAKTGNFHYAQRQGEATVFDVDPKLISDFEQAWSGLVQQGGKK